MNSRKSREERVRKARRREWDGGSVAEGVSKDAYRILNYCFSQCEQCIITQPYHSNDTIWAQRRRQLLSSWKMDSKDPGRLEHQLYGTYLEWILAANN